MAKGDDALARKKNKSNRKKMNRKNDSATVSTRIAAIIAAKKRRQTGKRSMCQGMCFSLPTPEDPFNEKLGKVDIAKKKKKKAKAKTRDALSVNKSLRQAKKKPSRVSIGGPPKFLMLCLSDIESSFHQLEKPLFTSTWGIEFWKSFHSGKDVVETSGTSSTLEQIAWIVSTATDAISTREKDEENPLSNSPFLLYLVPSQSKAAQVRSVCKALKRLGVHAVSLHNGAELDHQISGLKSLEPEFLVSTPERLLEIVALKGVDISGVSLLVIDELGSLCASGYLDAVKSIKQAISSEHRSIVFNDSFSASYIPAVQSLLGRSVNRLSLSDSVASQASCIIQTVNVCASEKKKLQKFSEVLDSTTSSRGINIVAKEESFRKLTALLKLKGLSVVIANSEPTIIPAITKRGGQLAYLIDIEQFDSTGMNNFETVLLPDFVPSFQTYVEILTSMARDSVRGVLHSFVTEEEDVSGLAGSLVNVLADCGQCVPDSWRNLSASMSD
ncbi:ATP-dependent RNA helicase DBP3 [Brassica rapa]|uniref:DEAD/DEAH-box helicase domain-containing protein n=1 Tax=Brassica campestris TaxID=3711 RepID=M4EPZ8_BRACM|nr:ATP-dependent RNA helicase DBP3 [Brassica rapa]